jgi:lipopolysaccharide/colanic/teichoic acid biosynthesis glycosyltransferase
MCLPPKRTHCNTMERAPTVNRRQELDGNTGLETGYPSPRTVTSPVQFAKRGIDIVVSLVGLAATLPLYPAIMAAIAIDSRGPFFFRQKRAGRLLSTSGHGRDLKFEEFSMIKFRTMKVDAEKGTGAVLADEQDPRVSRVGRFLRKSRLDEIPQFINVLRGDMSIVGPRPERPELLENLALAIPYFEERMRGVKPGITGLAQVALGYTGRPKTDSEVLPFLDSLTNPFKVPGADGALADDMRMKLLYDLAYCAALEEFSTFLRTEMSIIIRTPLVMLKGLGR